VCREREPPLPAAVVVAGHRDTARLDLAVGDPTGLHRDDRVVAVQDLGVALGLAAHVAAVLLAVLDPLRREHQSSPLSAVSAAGVPGVSSGTGAVASAGAGASAGAVASAGAGASAGAVSTAAGAG